MREAALGAIRFYKRHIDGKKGFKCAYGALHGGETCSEVIDRLFREESFFDAVRGTHAQLTLCDQADQVLNGTRRSLLSSGASLLAGVSLLALSACGGEPCQVGKECDPTGACGI